MVEKPIPSISLFTLFSQCIFLQVLSDVNVVMLAYSLSLWSKFILHNSVNVKKTQ